jgi:hypothetical protein
MINVMSKVKRGKNEENNINWRNSVLIQKEFVKTLVTWEDGVMVMWR